MSALALLVSLILTLTPAECREVGVDVADDDRPTAIVVEEIAVKRRDVPGLCAGIRRGCAWNLWPGGFGTKPEYRIIYSDEHSRKHEYCAAIFETDRHTEDHDRRY